MLKNYLDHLEDCPVEHGRFLTLRRTLQTLQNLLANRLVLDFGASYGLSACAFLEAGASKVIGVEPDEGRVRRGRKILHELGLATSVVLLYTPCTNRLPFVDCSFDVVFANAVLEHIPQPRFHVIQEIWRVLAPGGHLIINETPNKYIPIDFHTTGGLWFVPWLPRKVARRYAIWRGRFSEEKHWESSGWRGVGYYEITKALGRGHSLVPEHSRLRHRVLSRLHLPASLFDPYPTLVFEKREIQNRRSVKAPSLSNIPFDNPRGAVPTSHRRHDLSLR